MIKWYNDPNFSYYSQFVFIHQNLIHKMLVVMSTNEARFRLEHGIYLGQMLRWILISQPVQYTTTMAENSNFIAGGQKKLF